MENANKEQNQSYFKVEYVRNRNNEQLHFCIIKAESIAEAVKKFWQDADKDLDCPLDFKEITNTNFLEKYLELLKAKKNYYKMQFDLEGWRREIEQQEKQLFNK